ncbi:MAG: histidine phosphatase family protein [Chloroflexota bacterium]
MIEHHAYQTIVLVSHTVINRIILLDILGLGNDRVWYLRQEPCAIKVIEAEGGDYTLVSMNDTSHIIALETPR